MRAHHDRDPLSERSARTERVTERRYDAGLGADVDGGERVIQYEQPRIARCRRRDGARQTHPLALAARDAYAQLADFGVEPTRKSAHILFENGEPHHPREEIVGGGRTVWREYDVFPQRAREQERILRQVADQACALTIW